VGGEVSGAWTLTCSPYLAQDTIRILDDSTLAIKPEVEVRFQGNHEFIVYGALISNGTETDSIIFVMDSLIHDPWAGIRFWYADVGCALCLIAELKGGLADAGVHLTMAGHS
jgi:hypothetical protein